MAVATRTKKATPQKAQPPAVRPNRDPELPAYIKDGFGRGSEQVTTQDMMVPRLDIIQSLSPQRERGNEAYIEGATEGLLFNSVTGDLYEECIVVPVMFQKGYALWIDRKAGGGFRGLYPTMVEADAKKATLEDNERRICDIVETDNNICLLVGEEDDGSDTEEVMLSWTRSKLKVSRKWNSMIRMKAGDRFSRQYKLSSVVEKGAKGTFHNFSIEEAGFPTEGVYRKAESLYQAISSGKVKVRDVEAESRGGVAEATDRQDI